LLLQVITKLLYLLNQGETFTKVCVQGDSSSVVRNYLYLLLFPAAVVRLQAWCRHAAAINQLCCATAGRCMSGAQQRWSAAAPQAC
jgi:hypothetical protein